MSVYLGMGQSQTAFRRHGDKGDVPLYLDAPARDLFTSGPPNLCLTPAGPTSRLPLCRAGCPSEGIRATGFSPPAPHLRGEREACRQGR